MSNNKSNSPFFAIGQGINQLLDYRMIAAAGAPRNFLGTAIGAVGSLISRLDFSQMSKEDPIPPEITDTPEIKIENEDFGKLNFLDKYGDIVNTIIPNSVKDLGDIQITALKPRKPVVPVVPKEDPILENLYLPNDNPNAPGVNVGPGNTGMDTNILSGKLGNPDQERKNQELLPNVNTNKINIDTTKILEEEKKKEQLKKEKEIFGENSGLGRLKPEILEIIEGSRYKRKGKDDTKLHRIGYFLRSPFYQTKNRPYKELAKVAETPGDAFSLLPGGINPATQAYNAVIESENYRRRIENEFDEDLTKEIGSLNVDLNKANVTGQQRQDLLDLSLKNKKQLSEAFQKYADGKISKSEYEMLKTNLLAEVNTLSSDLGLIKAKAADFLKNKDNIDLAASDPEVADFYQTAIKNPDSIRIVEINGIKYFKGTTNGGKDFQIEVGAISNGDASFLLTEKADATAFVKNALTTMQNFVIEGKTKLGMGEFQLQDNTEMVDGKLVKSRIRTIGENKLIADLKQNQDMTRSLLAQYRGINYEGYQTLINQDRDGDGETTSQEIQQNEQEMLLQLAEEMYDEFVGPQYNPRSKTTRMNTQSGGTKLTAAERERLALGQLIGTLPTPSEQNFDQYLKLLDTTKYDHTIKNGKLLIGEKGKKKEEINFTDPGFKERFSKFTILPPYFNIQQNNTQVTNTSNTDPLGII